MIDLYDKFRDDSLDFPEEDYGEPTLEEIKEKSFYCRVDESAGERERRYGDA